MLIRNFHGAKAASSASGKMTGEAKRHNLSDWLALHDLDQSLCRRILSAAAGQVGSQTANQEEFTLEEYALDPEVAWLTVVDAMHAFFPAQRSFIEGTFEKTSKIRVHHSKTSQRALTLDSGKLSNPTILYTYFGKASDLFVLAHEFAHALQIVASEGKFVTPIIREVCAFVGEIALLSHSRNVDKGRYIKLRRTWYDEDRKYFILDREKLDLDFGNLDASYRYCWNYPVARYLASEISKKYSQERTWMLFRGNLSVRQLLQELEDDRI